MSIPLPPFRAYHPITLIHCNAFNVSRHILFINNVNRKRKIYIYLGAGGASGPGQSDGRQDLHHHSSSVGDDKKRRRDLRAGEGNRRGDGHPRRLNCGGWPLRPSARPPRGRDGVEEESVEPRSVPPRRRSPLGPMVEKTAPETRFRPGRRIPITTLPNKLGNGLTLRRRAE